jgi:hypothetical protein
LNGGARADEFTRGYRAWMLFMLMLMNALNLADRQGLAAVAPVLKRDLHLSDTELGVIRRPGLAGAAFSAIALNGMGQFFSRYFVSVFQIGPAQAGGMLGLLQPTFAVAIVFGLVGTGLGPTIVGVISDLAARHSFGAGDFAALCPGGAGRPGAEAALTSACSISSAYGIRFAMIAVVFLLLWGSLHYFLAARTLRADLDRRYQPD